MKLLIKRLKKDAAASTSWWRQPQTTAGAQMWRIRDAPPWRQIRTAKRRDATLRNVSLRAAGRRAAHSRRHRALRPDAASSSRAGKKFHYNLKLNRFRFNLHRR